MSQAADLHSLPSQGNDRFSPFHILLQLALAGLFFFANELDRIFNLWFLLVPIIGIPAIIVVIVWVTSIVSNLIRRKWRQFVSAAVAPLIIWPLLAMLLHNGIDPHWVRFQLNKQSFEATVQMLKSPHPQHYAWDWGSTGGVAVANIFYSLEYDESGQVVLKEGKGPDGGIITVRSFGNHFYLVTTIYQ